MLAKAPNRKRAVAYLEASGAAAISIIEHGVCSISTGRKTGVVTTPVSTWWIAERDAPRSRSGPSVRWR